MYVQRLEARPWFETGNKLDGPAAFQLLKQRTENHQSRTRCVYVHIPFCESICDFCALYTKAVKHDQVAVFDNYLDTTLSAIRAHPYANIGTTPTTVHFGGGTPLHIGLERFSKLVSTLREAFGHDVNTEWAIEVTTSSMTEETLTALKALDFKRIHLGIQTLDDGIRKSCGRQETKSQCLEKVRLVKQAGFHQSVDLIIGLEGMTEELVLQDLEQLYETGVRMFSLCELRHRSKRQYAQCHTQDRIEQNYQFWQVVWAFMSERDLKPIHIGQFGRDYEDNLYFTHPARNEDCIAIGPYAHGSYGNLYYSNKLLPEYHKATIAVDGLIQHAVEYPGDIQVIRQLESELLAHHVSDTTLSFVSDTYGDDFSAILTAWQKQGYLQQLNDHHYTLSCEGSWYVGNMCLHLRQLPQLHSQREIGVG